MTCECNKHVAFYRGHKITLKYHDGLSTGWYFIINGDEVWKESSPAYRYDYQAYDAATKHIDAELAKPNTDGE